MDGEKTNNQSSDNADCLDRSVRDGVGHLRADPGTCNGQMITLPFTDVAGSMFFCSIAEAYFSGLTNGTSPTTYSPSQNVPRDQMAAFISRTQDSALRRGSRRAALDQWTQGAFASGGMTDTDTLPSLVKSDGEDLFVANLFGTVSQVHASNGKLLGTWTGADLAFGVAIARGRVFVTGQTSPGKLYRIDPKQAPGAVTVVTSTLSGSAHGITTMNLSSGWQFITHRFPGLIPPMARSPLSPPADSA